ncbi:helix-turn-helix domain-containing protein [Streptomyces abikoensis]|uniref:helix-turn-helix domain-containing protein n=1 Tax=Streptomyces abikoensis TaxID=97398 RepID=UPI0033CF8525
MVMTPLRVEFSPAQVAELRRRLRCRELVPNERMRLECVRLAAQGRTAPEIAMVLEKHVVTVRGALHRFRERGVDLDSSWLSVLLHRDGFRWKRTHDSIRHRADPALQAAAWERLEGLRLYG